MRLSWVMLLLLPLTINMVSAQWWPIVRLTNTETASVPEGIAVEGNYVNVIWHDEYAPGHVGTFFCRSSDGGGHWSSSVLLDSSTVASNVLASGNSNVHVFLGTTLDYCYYKRSTNNGATWLPKVLLASGYYAAPARNLASCLHVAFLNGHDSILIKNSTNNGASWDSARFVVWRDQMSGGPYLAADNSSRLHLCWADAMGGQTEAFYDRSTDNGASWQPKVSLGRVGWLPSGSVVVDNQNNVYVFGVDASGQGFMVRSTDGGATWGSRISQWQSASACSNNGWLHGAINYSTGDVTEVKYVRSKDFGETWDMFDVSEVDSVNSDWSYLAVSDSLVHFVWRDFAPGNAEVYYRRGVLDMTGVLEERCPSARNPLVLYPQPATTVLYIEGGLTNVISLRIYDVSGRRINNAKWNYRSGVVSVGLDALPSGVYSAFMMTGMDRAVFKFVVRK